MTTPWVVGGMPVRIGHFFPIALSVSVLAAGLGTSRVAEAVNPAFAGVSPVTDGAGGAIFAWLDSRTSTPGIYAGRIGSDGTLRWLSSGHPVCVTPGYPNYPRAASDGQGGAFVMWIDSRGSGITHVYAQHINPDGVTLWEPDGVRACLANGTQEDPRMVPDGAGGIIVTWEDWRSGVDIYAQRIDASGAIVWGDNGVPVCAAAGSQYEPEMASDGAGGAIIAWPDFRGGNGNVYAQRVDASGAPLWTPDGVSVLPSVSIEALGGVFPCVGGGAFVTCGDFGQGALRIQRLDGDGVTQWGGSGISPCTVPYSGVIRVTSTAPDAADGMILLWLDAGRGGVWGQDLALDGSLGWGPGGQLLAGVGYYFSAQPDGAGGLFIGSQRDLDQNNAFAKAAIQRVDASGAALWGATGIELPATTSYLDAPMPVVDGAGGVIFLWGDHNRNCGMHPPCYPTGTINEYARRYDGSGTLTWSSIALTSTQPVAGVWPDSPVGFDFAVIGPNPTVDDVRLRLALPTRMNVRLTLHDVAGRLVARLVDGEMPAGEHTVTGRTTGAGVYYARIQAGVHRVTRRVVVLE